MTSWTWAACCAGLHTCRRDDGGRVSRHAREGGQPRHWQGFREPVLQGRHLQEEPGSWLRHQRVPVAGAAPCCPERVAGALSLASPVSSPAPTPWLPEPGRKPLGSRLARARAARGSGWWRQSSGQMEPAELRALSFPFLGEFFFFFNIDVRDRDKWRRELPPSVSLPSGQPGSQAAGAPLPESSLPLPGPCCWKPGVSGQG